MSLVSFMQLQESGLFCRYIRLSTFVRSVIEAMHVIQTLLTMEFRIIVSRAQIYSECSTGQKECHDMPSYQFLITKHSECSH